MNPLFQNLKELFLKNGIAEPVNETKPAIMNSPWVYVLCYGSATFIYFRSIRLVSLFFNIAPQIGFI